ncbi:MAG: hypothetical protein B7Z02_13525 [Rhodobacterales bacterium 32-67-9]|nr:MAG: hypothetical protein B7Z02_13525 [Rhodobacterales bacterium 32-67-9]
MATDRAAEAAEGTAGWREILAARHLAPLILVCVGVWLHAADALLITTMMPAIIEGIGGAKLVAWNFALYEIGSITAGAASGLVALRWGPRLPMAVAAVLFASGCLVSAAAPSMPVLLAGRVAQGLGGGGLVSLSFVAVGRLFPGPLMPRAMAAMSLVWGASAFLGPLAGGIFVTYATWRAGFLFFGLQAAALSLWIGFGLRIAAAPDTVAPARLPVTRLALLAAAILGVAYAGIAATPALMALSLGAGLAALALFARRDARSGADRLWPRGALDPRTPVGAGLVMVLAMNVGTMGLATYGPLLLDLIHGTPALVAGYVVAAVSIAWTVSAVLVAGAPARRDPATIGVGMTLVAVSIALTVYAVPNGPLGLIAFCAVLEGFGYGMAWTFIMRRASALAAPEDVDRLSAALPTIARLGYALGAAAMGILANRAGFGAGSTPTEAAHVARVIFAGSLPIVGIGVFAMVRFVTAREGG